MNETSQKSTPGQGGLSRRSFLSAAAGLVASGPLILPSRVLGRGGATPPSERINLGIIGLGDRGNAHLQGFMPLPQAQIRAVCDVYRSKAEACRAKAEAHYSAQADAAWKGCDAVQDFHEIMAREDIDAVVIAAPENWHALLSLAAMQAGKDLYCEKALSLTVAEGRAVCNAVRRHGSVFQAGTQQRSDRNFRFACELARNGYLGKVHSAFAAVPGGRALPLLPLTPPAPDLDYELWLGPAAWQPHREGLCSFNWYFVSDYCAGWIQSWGVHHMDIALWGLPEFHASTMEVDGTATFPTEGEADTSIEWKTRLRTPGGVTLEFASDALGAHGHGVRFVGDKGWVHVTRAGIQAEPASLLGVTLTSSDEHLYVSEHHQLNFLQSIRTRQDPASPVESCHRATVATLVADIATRLGRKVKWDWAAERFVNDDEANRLLTRAMRAPWQV